MNKTSKDPKVLIQELEEEAKRIVKDIDETNANLRAGTDAIEKKVNKTTKELDKIYSDLDDVEKKANDQFDSLVLEQISDLDAIDNEDEK